MLIFKSFYFLVDWGITRQIVSWPVRDRRSGSSRILIIWSKIKRFLFYKPCGKNRYLQRFSVDVNASMTVMWSSRLGACSASLAVVRTSYLTVEWGLRLARRLTNVRCDAFLQQCEKKNLCFKWITNELKGWNLFGIAEEEKVDFLCYWKALNVHCSSFTSSFKLLATKEEFLKYMSNIC